MNPVLITAGENSGEKYGAELVRQFKKKHPSADFFGIGGKNMEKEGVEILFPITDLAVTGLVEVISHIPRIKKIFKQLEKAIIQKKPNAAILIDSPDFNLRMAKILKKYDIPVYYYISPTVWAWRKNRLKLIKKTVRKMLLIFPFEEDIYRSHNIPAVYVGHPLREKVKIRLAKEDFFKKYDLDQRKKLITLLPGSRKNEIKNHMPVLRESLKSISREYEVQYVLLLAENLEKELVSEYISNGIDDIKLITENGYEAMAYSDLILSSCGSANLEAALLETPIITFYRLSPLTYNLGIKLIKIKNYSIVNILVENKIIPELIQRDFTPEKLFSETKKILDSVEIRTTMIKQLKKIKNILGEKIASQNAANELGKLIIDI
jgi:lipid-A-disaccharide synthase